MSSTSTAQGQWLEVTDHLIAEFDFLAPGHVISSVALCRRRLVSLGLCGEGLLTATESMARSMLSSEG